MVILALDHVSQCFSTKDGMVINDVLRKQIAEYGSVTLSLKGVSDIPSSFVNAALVSLLDDHDFEWIKKNVAVIQATRQATDMIRRCFANATHSVAA
jgi:hypothetical protein